MKSKTSCLTEDDLLLNLPVPEKPLLPAPVLPLDSAFELWSAHLPGWNARPDFDELSTARKNPVPFRFRD